MTSMPKKIWVDKASLDWAEKIGSAGIHANIWASEHAEKTYGAVPYVPEAALSDLKKEACEWAWKAGTTTGLLQIALVTLKQICQPALLPTLSAEERCQVLQQRAFEAIQQIQKMKRHSSIKYENEA